MKKKKWKSVLLWVLLISLTAFLFFLPQIARRSGDENASVQSTTVSRGEIETTIAGGGALKAQHTEEVCIPDGVEILHFMVSNGDLAEKGQPLAEIDISTAVSAAAKVQDSVDRLSTQLEEATETGKYTLLESTITGRVKALYAQPGDAVQDTILEHGALALISLDGLMKAEFPSEAKLKPHEEVIVVTSDGIRWPGEVESAVNGNICITVTDDGPRLDDRVRIENLSGEKLGEAVLAVHSPWRLLASGGTVWEIYIENEQNVYNWTDFMRLTGTNSTELSRLSDKLHRYEELLQKLLSMADSGYVAAPFSGYISEIEKTFARESGLGSYSGYLSAASESTEELFPLEGKTILKITPADKMTVTIPVDERDVLRFEKGMSADILADALPGRVFSGTVAAISAKGSNEGGSSKFEVTLELDRQKDMLDGMNASVIIHISKTGDVLTLPCAALYDSGSSCYVYTAYDTAKDRLSAPVIVTVGASDGDRFEVISGLSEGQTVWYTKFG